MEYLNICCTNSNKYNLIYSKWMDNNEWKYIKNICKWCSNSIQPDLQTLDKIAKLLDVGKAKLV